MHTFVFIASIENDFPKNILETCQHISNKWMPSLEETTASQTLLPGSKFGWFWLEPKENKNSSIISEAIKEQYAVIAFGKVLNQNSYSAAQSILDAYSFGGPAQVRELEGGFSAVIVDRFHHQVVIISDISGQCSLRYYSDGRILIVSPHDIPIIATGVCSLEYDYTSICSIAALGCSLRGNSLIKDIQTCHPSEYLVWSNSQIQHCKDPIIAPSKRISCDNSLAISQNLARMIEVMQANIKFTIRNEPEVNIELSAGVDSRTVLGLLLSVIDNDYLTKVNPICVGETNSTDVRVAQKLSELYKFKFSSIASHAPNPENFVRQCDLLAFSVNGDSRSTKLMTQISGEDTNNTTLQLHGNGGELFRGTYYPKNLLKSQKLSSHIDVLNIIRRKTRIDSIDWKSANFANYVVDRLHSTIDQYTAISPNPYDILDIYYFYERLGVWGAARERMTWKNLASPFFNRQTIRLAYTMPSPIGHYATVHHEIIRRFLPKAYWIRINGKRLLPLEPKNSITSFLNTVDHRYLSIMGKIQRKLNKCQRAEIGQLRANALAGPLREVIYEVLTAKDSFTLEILGKQGIEKILNEHNSYQKNHLSLLGSLITMERWRAMISDVYREASGLCGIVNLTTDHKN